MPCIADFITLDSYNISSEPNMLIDFKISINFSHALGLYILMPGRLFEMSSLALLAFI